MKLAAIVSSLLWAHTLAQQRGTVTTEQHPLLSTQKCTTSGGCVTQNTKVVLDANWRWLHGTPTGSNYPSCETGAWNPSLCPDPTTCANNCYLDGISSSGYVNTYGVSTNGNALTLALFPGGGGVGSRVYLMSDDSHYQTINLLNQEISFDVDVSGLPCGTNGALYLTNMAADGGQSAYSTNKAGAYMGTGYCDAQCPQDGKFINGQANMLNWNGNTGRYGNCCPEMDVWEANAAATAMTAHTCSTLGRCDSSTTQCGTSGWCDHAGCDFNPFRLGNTSFYGLGDTVNTAPGRIRVITQFKTTTGTASGALSLITRSYIRNGVVIYNSYSDVSGVTGNGLTDTFCAQEAAAFGQTNTFKSNGGMAALQRAMGAGMVLTMSVYIDYATQMLWLDSVFPNGANPAGAGNTRGPCPTNSGTQSSLQSNSPNAQVTFANIKWGDIGTTQ